jgi:ankyrin repeat protein
MENSPNGYTKSKNGTTPLHIAAKMGNMEIVKYLIEEKKCNIEEAREIEEGEKTKDDK